MAFTWIKRLLPASHKYQDNRSWLHTIVSGGLYKLSDIRGNSDVADIRTQIDTMRAVARDSQISTALSYYATDATTMNTAGQIIWATSDNSELADIVNELFKRWNVNNYARDHILELATIGNLYIPTTLLYAEPAGGVTAKGVVLDNNTIPDPEYDIIPSTKIPPESIIHVWKYGKPKGYILDPEDDGSGLLLLPESACIHFSLGGLLGDYTIHATTKDGDEEDYDIQFATPLMAQAVQPTQTLSLLEDATVLSSLSRTVKFINVEAGTEETEIRNALQQIKDAIEQQLSLNTASGDAQSFVNPQSPNNLIYLPKINGQDAISITDLNMAEAADSENNLLNYYQDKKLSVLGVPKEAMNFSSNEGLGGAGSVLSQRSALYANALQRIETAYMNGWYDAINKYFVARNMSGFIDKYTLHMNPIITVQSTVQFDKRDSALNQASAAIDMLKNLGIKETEPYTTALTEILTEVFPQIGGDAGTWNVDIAEGGNENAGF